MIMMGMVSLHRQGGWRSMMSYGRWWCRDGIFEIYVGCLLQSKYLL
ncbi:hypothetical protein [Moraxella lacunata]